jgi:hypothetical protein
MPCSQDWGELYDLETDPDETDNLWNSAAHGEVKARLSLRWRISWRD